MRGAMEDNAARTVPFLPSPPPGCVRDGLGRPPQAEGDAMGNLQDEIEGDVGAVPVVRGVRLSLGRQRRLGLLEPRQRSLEIEAVFDRGYCHGPAKLRQPFGGQRQKDTASQKVRELNDRFRTTGQGNGSIMITSGIQDLGGEAAVAIVNAVRQFNDFSADNDPWGEHDFGAIEFQEQKIFWKIDAYDPTLTQGSENPANEALTHRVLTIMLASEY